MVFFSLQVADFSLSSFLGQLESPVKVTTQSHADSTIHIVKPPSDVSIFFFKPIEQTTVLSSVIIGHFVQLKIAQFYPETVNYCNFSVFYNCNSVLSHLYLQNIM